MQVSLFRALKTANISDDAAEKVVHAFEEHIDMAVAEAMKHYDDRITAMQSVLEAKLDAGFKSVDARFSAVDAKFSAVEDKIGAMKTSIDGLKWYIIILGSLMTTAVAAGGVLTAYVQLIK